jgi:hypothetical protein
MGSGSEEVQESEGGTLKFEDIDIYDINEPGKLDAQNQVGTSAFLTLIKDFTQYAKDQGFTRLDLDFG